VSISTQGGDQSRPSVVSTGKKPAAGGKPAASGGPAAGKSGGARPAGGGGRGGGGGGRGAGGGGKGPRKPIAPVKVAQGRAWGPIALFVAVGLVAAGIIGYGGYAVLQGAKTWEDQASSIDGLTNYRDNPDKTLTARDHVTGPVQYSLTPPVGGNHNTDWQNCMGDVYDAPIANEHAVHSMEHGAVWVTYKSDLPADQVSALASKVRGNEYMLMSPIDNLDKPISLQAWGYQLKLDDANDSRIDAFIKALRTNASMEQGAACSGGITATGTTPRDLPPPQQQGS
jgi:hypothetical protein